QRPRVTIQFETRYITRDSSSPRQGLQQILLATGETINSNSSLAQFRIVEQQHRIAQRYHGDQKSDLKQKIKEEPTIGSARGLSQAHGRWFLEIHQCNVEGS
ncbi:MAG: hypothetical protein EZS28_031825, partial [Streblomastix strix]